MELVLSTNFETLDFFFPKCKQQNWQALCRLRGSLLCAQGGSRICLLCLILQTRLIRPARGLHAFEKDTTAFCTCHEKSYLNASNCELCSVTGQETERNKKSSWNRTVRRWGPQTRFSFYNRVCVCVCVCVCVVGQQFSPWWKYLWAGGDTQMHIPNLGTRF